MGQKGNALPNKIRDSIAQTSLDIASGEPIVGYGVQETFSKIFAETLAREFIKEDIDEEIFKEASSKGGMNSADIAILYSLLKHKNSNKLFGELVEEKNHKHI